MPNEPTASEVRARRDLNDAIRWTSPALVDYSRDLVNVLNRIEDLLDTRSAQS